MILQEIAQHDCRLRSKSSQISLASSYFYNDMRRIYVFIRTLVLTNSQRAIIIQSPNITANLSEGKEVQRGKEVYMTRLWCLFCLLDC